MKLPIGAAVTAAGATLLDASDGPREICPSTDTRTLRVGDAFVALRGASFDGHDYAAEAVRRGAAMLILDRPEARVPGVPTMIVAETTSAYVALAALARRRFAGRVLAITGSAGKTTTKAFATQLLASRYGERVLAAPANENNEIGVAKLLLAACDEAHDAIVVEMGARHADDIATLADLALPDVGILTNVGDAHLEIFGSRARLADAKWALFSRGARAVLNADDAVARSRAPSLTTPPHWFAARDGGFNGAVAAARFTGLFGGSRLAGTENGTPAFDRRVDVRVPGRHNRINVAAAVAGALELGVALGAIVATLPALQMPPGRFESFAMPGGWRIIYDAYNASAAGSIAALDALRDERPERAIAVLGGMAELGDESALLHERVGTHAARRADVVLAGGEHGDDLARGARAGGLGAGAVVRIASNAEAVRWLREHARPGDVVLLKASRKYRLEDIVRELGS